MFIGCRAELTPHSIRRGSATFAYASGRTLEQIKKLGRWRSVNGMKPYIADALKGQGGAAKLPSAPGPGS